MLRIFWLSLILVFVLLSCGKKDPVNPDDPTPVPPTPSCGAVAKAGPDQFIKLGQQVRIGVSQNDPNAKFFWFPKGETATPFESATFVQPKVTTNYLLMVRSKCGMTSDYVRVFVSH